MLWLSIALSAYVVFALVNLVDKYVLKHRIGSPKVYAFYVGVLGIFTLLLAPFGLLKVPAPLILSLALVAGACHTVATWILFEGLKRYEASRIIPAEGAMIPIFTLGFTLIFGQAGGRLGPGVIAAFVLLVAGTILITYERKRIFNKQSLGIAFLSALLYAAFFIMMKSVYEVHPFISALIWSGVGAFTASLFFLFSKSVRSDIFGSAKIAQGNTWLIVMGTQIAGAGAIVLQNLAIALAPFAYLGVINALDGTKYFFLLLFAILISAKFPGALKEEISKKVITQKAFAILLMGVGMLLLSLSKL